MNIDDPVIVQLREQVKAARDVFDMAMTLHDYSTERPRRLRAAYPRSVSAKPFPNGKPARHLGRVRLRIVLALCEVEHTPNTDRSAPTDRLK